MKSTSLNIIYEQATAGSYYSESELKDIAELIYQTDPYVYPALFQSEETAIMVIPSLIENEDAMFRRDNLFLARADGRIVGLILWKQGPLEWTDDILKRESCRLGIETSPYLELVKKEYFEFYKTIPEDVISIINVCVKAEFRNYGIGKALFHAFLEAHSDCSDFELLVLEDNKNAVHLYETAGFRITQVFQGFSVDNRDLPCLKMEKGVDMKTIYLAGGCFWGLQKFFDQFDGVVETEVGYANGPDEAPTYRDVCNSSGHAETVRIAYDDARIALAELLKYYFMVIDPLSVNRQGNDRGIQYRTGIYYTDADQLPEIEAVYRAEEEKAGTRLAVELEPLVNFYSAEEYHQKYLDKNPGGYCHIPSSMFHLR